MTSDAADAPAQWQQRTLERTLGAARARALSRGDQFIAAAAELLGETGRPDFTVQQVVDRSGLSLRSFYQHFAVKEDLLLALVEETVNNYVRHIRPRLARIKRPTGQLKLVLTQLYSRDDPASRGMIIFVWQLIASRTSDFIGCLSPQTELLTEILEAGVAQGEFRDDVSVPSLVAYLTHSTNALIHMRVMGISLAGEQVSTDEFWSCCLAAVAAR
jgi:AcrR family transcriptional regulator